MGVFHQLYRPSPLQQVSTNVLPVTSDNTYRLCHDVQHAVGISSAVLALARASH